MKSVKDLYPLPRIDDSLDTIRGNVWFGTVDLSSGYYQVGMDPNTYISILTMNIC
jgi:hypothetical protein